MLRESFALLHQSMSQLECHRVFSKVGSPESLREFMQWHVFAVWDFMSLIKRLQREFTCVSVPWLPPRDLQAARLINEIVLGEESDEDGRGEHGSHFDLYLCAMKEVGACTRRIDNFIDSMRTGATTDHSLASIDAPSAVAGFVRATLETAQLGTVPQVLGSFLYGRESVIPAMFARLINEGCVDFGTAPTLAYYLDRHISLDSESHGPAAESIAARMIHTDPSAGQALIDSGLRAVEQRTALWDALSAHLDTL